MSTHTRPSHSNKNPSAFRIADEITTNIQYEMLTGKVQRVHMLPQFYVISPLGAVEKKANRLTTGWRHIHDLHMIRALTRANGPS